ncbi:cell filamentation protein Fic [Bifidobacterium aemilianum]|uniref:protein adenylyltransferase n=1 Tax=Bifidobacterium aemilianum TaxID=2493120 RepID=A0A366K956_9BIFI|nr:Fic family protein [Bifidobacterium aemilianum]RBP98214.1 cell filamentation protein Fic [Bifidobacterium aemilianum]
MTPAERASAMAFALCSGRLDGLEASGRIRRVAYDYQLGNLDLEDLWSEAGLDDDTVGTEASVQSLADRILVRTIFLQERGWPMTGDLRELQSIHRCIFHGIYPHAGLLRTSDTEPRQRGSPQTCFPWQLIATGAMNISGELAERQNLGNLDRSRFIQELTLIYDQLGYLHPFSQGNAITLRIFASRLAHYAGWDLDWGQTDRRTYQVAQEQAYLGCLEPFGRLFTSIVRPANPTRIFLIAGWDQGPAH